MLVETLLVYFTGGLDSPFSFLYLVSIITASMLLYRRGGLLAARGAVILYGVLGDLMYYGVLPMPEQSLFCRAVDVLAALPEHGHELRRLLRHGAAHVVSVGEAAEDVEELDANRQNLAELRALNQNVVESIPSGLITLSPYGIGDVHQPGGLLDPPA